jgi:prolyl oligopeptidase
LAICVFATARPAVAALDPVPETPKVPTVETIHGVTISDDYRWLEKPPTDPDVHRWTERQNVRTRTYLDGLPSLAGIRARLLQWSQATSADYTSVAYRGGMLFALKSQPPKEQPFLVWFTDANDLHSERIVLDPNGVGKAGGTAIDFFEPSRDGRLVAVSMSEGGSEEGTLTVYETKTGGKLPDVVPRVTYPTAGGSVAWNSTGTGFYYTHYPRPGERSPKDMRFYQQVYFHRVGTPEKTDRYVVGREFPPTGETVLTGAPDGRHFLATVQKGDGGEFVHYLFDDLGRSTQLTQYTDQVSTVAFGLHDDLYLFSRKNAPRGQILHLPLATPKMARSTVAVPASDTTIAGLRFTSNTYETNFFSTENRLYVVDSIGGPSQIRLFDHQGHLLNTVPIPEIAAVEQIVPLARDAILFRAETYLQPPAWYAYDPTSGLVKRTAMARTAPVDFEDSDVIREFAVSKDGTRVPLNIIHRKGMALNGHNPVLLYGYGGFSISQTPGFSVARRIWLDRGGVLAIANLRGGSEYGEEWHRAGNLTHKQNVFDDFLACAQLLIDRRYTCPSRLAIEGGSNGGLLIGAALTQRPDLFGAAVAHVGLFDMVHFENHPNGVFIAAEYGSVKDAAEFRALYAYSPFHHVKDGTAYPAVLLTAGENDGRVDPAQSRKMAARLQAATGSKAPILLRMDSGAGHGIGSGLSKRIAETADTYAFLFQELDMEAR